ncbi:MFS transporter [Singulisphaera sp. Ch08]|uniref:MFS transporter n=1 Tax=Singulisphaera sp. Ch08 TaxID=3120278 RepID=A0AAU7CCM0_9BACT
MATSETSSAYAKLASVGDQLLAGRPMVALVAVLLTTGGHTMNLREMGVSQGWVAAEVYALQSCYLVSLALMMLACPALSQRWSCRGLTQSGLVLAVVGSLLNVLELGEPLSLFLVGRVVAGAGAGMVIYFAPHLLARRWQVAVAWAAILCPVAGPGAVSIATMMYESSDWQYGFLFEGVAAAIGLAALLSMAETPESPARTPRGSLAYLPGLVVAAAALIYGLHWGQLHGWLESDDIVAATATCVCALCVSLGLAWPHLDWDVLRENWTRLALFFFGGMCQFFHGYIMNIYGGMIVNLSSWQRTWLIWPLPIGIAVSLAFSRLRWRHHRVVLGLPGTIVGLMLLAGGLHLCYQQMMEWPYWDIRDVVDLNWFPAPGQWELAPGRFLMGLGIGLFMVAMDTQFSPDPEREETVRPFLNFVQFLGGGIAAAVLINFLIIGHKIHYSYSADRDTIQAEELSERGNLLSGMLRQTGQTAPEHSAEVMMYRFVNYEADNLVFATIYAIFFLTAIALAGFFVALWIWRRLRAAPDTITVANHGVG